MSDASLSQAGISFLSGMIRQVLAHEATPRPAPRRSIVTVQVDRCA